MQTIYTVDALAGAGKTHGACVWSLEQARKDRKVVIVQPSKELIKQTRQTLAKLECDDIKVIEITSRTQPGKVTAALIDHVKHSPEEVGEILLITHAAFIDLPYWHRPGSWTVIIDELLTVVTDLSLTIPEEHKRLTDQVKLQPFNPTYSRMVPAETQSLLTSLATNPRRDQVWSVFNETAKRLLDPNWSIFTKTANYHRILEDDGEADAHKLMLFGRLHPSIVAGFGKVILMGAMLEESLLYSLWSAEGVTFKPHPIQDSLRYQKHDNGHLITIEFLWDTPWSKNFRDKKLPNSNQTVWDHVVSKTLAAMGGDPYIYLVNKDVEETMAERFTGGTAVSTVCHGLNRYDSIHKVVFLSALNPAPAHFAFVDTLGVNPDELRRSMYLQSLYQAVMRISARDPNSTAKKHIVVMDKDAAEYLETHFPGCTVKRSADMPAIASKTGGRKKVYRDNAAKARAAKTKQRIINEAVKLGHKDAVKSISIVPSVYSTDVIDYEITSNEALMTELRLALNLELSDKKANILISPSKFNVNKAADTKRGLENIESVCGIWLDNDGGDLSHKEFRKLFPDQWFAAFSTYTNEGRYRVFFPTRQCMTVEMDRMIKQMIIKVLNDAGYKATKVHEGDKVHGFDMGKLTPSSLFFIPCKRTGDKEAFFEEYPGTELDPVLWLSNPTISTLFDPTPELVPAMPVEPAVAASGTMADLRAKLAQDPAIVFYSNARIERAKADYLAVPIGAGQRNPAFYQLGLRLKHLGCSMVEIEGHLMSVAQDKDRRNQVPSILKSLRGSQAYTAVQSTD